MSPFTFNTVPSLIVGSGSIARLGEIAAQRLGPRVALVTDAGLVKAGLIAPALQALEEAGIAVDVFDGVVADPPEDVVLSAAARARDFEARAVIGFGGGSSIDVAKLVALLASSGENLPRSTASASRRDRVCRCSPFPPPPAPDRRSRRSPS